MSIEEISRARLWARPAWCRMRSVMGRVLACILIASSALAALMAAAPAPPAPAAPPPAAAPAQPAVVEGACALRAFRFASGEALPELRLHYRTLGTLRRDGGGVVRNAVLILHGTTGSGQGFLAETFAGRLFRSGQLLDAERYFL